MELIGGVWYNRNNEKVGFSYWMMYETLRVPVNKIGHCSLCVLYFLVGCRYDVFKEDKKYESNKNWRILEKSSKRERAYSRTISRTV